MCVHVNACVCMWACVYMHVLVRRMAGRVISRQPREIKV